MRVDAAPTTPPLTKADSARGACSWSAARRQIVPTKVVIGECINSFPCCIRLHFRWRPAGYAAARCVAGTSSKRGFARRGEAGDRTSRDACCACYRPPDRICAKLVQTHSNQIKQITANIILLDNLLARSGPQAQPLRPLLRGGVKILVERIWREKNLNAAKAAPFEASSQSDLFFDKLLELTPQNDGQRAMQTRALQIWIDLAQTRVLFAQTDSAIPMPFLAVLVFWLAIIFVSFGLFVRPNAMVVAALFVCALSAASAIFLILELGHPFSGLMTISSAPLSNALAPLGP